MYICRCIRFPRKDSGYSLDQHTDAKEMLHFNTMTQTIQIESFLFSCAYLQAFVKSNIKHCRNRENKFKIT